MVNHFYDLVDEENLPPGAAFVDPYDKTIFRPQPKETLNQFITKIVANRDTKGYPKLLDVELRQLVVASLFESCPGTISEKFFIKRANFPQVAQMLSLARAIAAETLKPNSVSLKQREERAFKCLDNCIFHNSKETWSKKLTKTIQSFVGLDNLVNSEAEKALGVCKMCGGCDLKSKVKFNLTSVLAATMPEQLARYIKTYGAPGFGKCWIFSESLNNPNSKTLLMKKLDLGYPGGVSQTLFKQYISNKVKEATSKQGPQVNGK